VAAKYIQHCSSSKQLVILLLNNAASPMAVFDVQSSQLLQMQQMQQSIVTHIAALQA
jgi:hypothetical protein